MRGKIGAVCSCGYEATAAIDADGADTTSSGIYLACSSSRIGYLTIYYAIPITSYFINFIPICITFFSPCMEQCPYIACRNYFMPW